MGDLDRPLVHLIRAPADRVVPACAAVAGRLPGTALVTRRISPRHCTETITVRPFAADGTIDGTLGDETTVRRVMVTESRQVVTAGDDVRVVSLLEVRLPDRDGLDVGAIFTPDSQVTYRGSTSIVLTCDRVLHRGQVAFWRITTGDRAPRFGGALPVIVHIVPATGRDTMGDPVADGLLDRGHVGGGRDVDHAHRTLRASSSSMRALRTSSISARESWASTSSRRWA